MSQLFNPPADTPVGGIIMWPTATPPTDWLILDGSSFSSTDYPELNTLLGGTTLPDMRQRFPFGKAASGTGSTLLGTFGSIDHLHTGPSHTHTGPSHTHDTDIAPFTSGANNQTGLTSLVLPGGPANPHDHTVNPPNTTSTASGTGSTGSGGTGNTGTSNPPGLALNFIIKAA